MAAALDIISSMQNRVFDIVIKNGFGTEALRYCNKYGYLNRYDLFGQLLIAIESSNDENSIRIFNQIKWFSPTDIKIIAIKCKTETFKDWLMSHELYGKYFTKIADQFLQIAGNFKTYDSLIESINTSRKNNIQELSIVIPLKISREPDDSDDYSIDSSAGIHFQDSKNIMILCICTYYSHTKQHFITTLENAGGLTWKLVLENKISKIIKIESFQPEQIFLSIDDQTAIFDIHVIDNRNINLNYLKMTDQLLINTIYKSCEVYRPVRSLVPYLLHHYEPLLLIKSKYSLKVNCKISYLSQILKYVNTFKHHSGETQSITFKISEHHQLLHILAFCDFELSIDAKYGSDTIRSCTIMGPYYIMFSAGGCFNDIKSIFIYAFTGCKIGSEFWSEKYSSAVAGKIEDVIDNYFMILKNNLKTYSLTKDSIKISGPEIICNVIGIPVVDFSNCAELISRFLYK